MNSHCVIRTKKDDIGAFIEKNKGIVAVYGAACWGGMLVENCDFKVDYLCDRNATWMHFLNGVPVIGLDALGEKIEESGKRATIIICVETKVTVNRIFVDLLHADLNADVFDYFENENVFCDTDFSLEGKKYKLFEHPYNCGYASTRMTERSVELALAKAYIEQCSGKIVEIGAVTPYYFYDDKIVEVIDPTDRHKRAIHKSIFDCDLTDKNVLSISTVEHIGTTDFGMHEVENAVDAIEKILREASSCLITAPFGYNSILDEWVVKNQNSDGLKFLKRYLNNHWEDITGQYEPIPYTHLWANGLVIIQKN
ncbi:MAG: hypothetical protein HDR16_08390 [Lachnospiraceae bacterium]|nr:hypothetical protein [Lachnospiraceae bacterium]